MIPSPGGARIEDRTQTDSNQNHPEPWEHRGIIDAVEGRGMNAQPDEPAISPHRCHHRAHKNDRKACEEILPRISGIEGTQCDGKPDQVKDAKNDECARQNDPGDYTDPNPYCKDTRTPFQILQDEVRP